MSNKKEFKDNFIFDYLRNSEGIKAPDSSVHMTIEDWEHCARELYKCKNDIIYFAEKYFTIIGPKGKQLIKLYPKQKEMIQLLVDHQKVVILSARQLGKTTVYTIFALWLTIFEADKQVLICANKEAAAIEFLDRIRLAYQLMPSFLKLGCKMFNRKKVVFENDSSIEASATSPDSARGKSGSCLTGESYVTVLRKGKMMQLPIYQLWKEQEVKQTLLKINK
jgi:hypothetical protein